MKNYSTPWLVGSMMICNKCGKTFDRPENAEHLKKDLRVFLKEKDANQDIRVMVSGCLNICVKDEQAVAFQPVNGPTEVFTVDKDYDSSYHELKQYLNKKLT
jgi:predicted metal-binding protein